MIITTNIRVSAAWANLRVGLLVFLLAIMSSVSSADIVWSGDFETGDFTQWPNGSDFGVPFYWGIPAYGRPIRYESETNEIPSAGYGDGSLLEIVTSPVRQGTYAAKYTVKNSANGSEPADNDGSISKRRRTELWMHKGIPSS